MTITVEPLHVERKVDLYADIADGKLAWVVGSEVVDPPAAAFGILGASGNLRRPPGDRYSLEFYPATAPVACA